MRLTAFSISRPLVVRMVLFLILVFGSHAYMSMPRFLDPDITVGEAFVYTVCPGFSPEEMEKLVTNKIEEELDGIAAIRKYESLSYESTSKIHIYFNTDLTEYEIDRAMQEVRDAVDRVEDLPWEAKAPRVIEIDVAVFPVCLVALSGDLPLLELQEKAKEIAEAIENIPGVSEVDILGKRQREIWVELDPGRLSAYGIGIPEIAGVISGRVKDLPGGSVDLNGHEISIRMKGEPALPAALGGISLRSGPQGAIFLRDVGSIVETLETPRTLAAVDGENAVILSVKRKRHTNVIKIVEEVRGVVLTTPQSYPGLRAEIYFDQAAEIKRRIKELQNNALMGMGAVFVILWIAMGAKNAIFACVGIPVSFLITFIFMKLCGFSIDALTLFALILVLGVLVDDAIVVLENIHRYSEMGVSPVQAALQGAKEVFAPVIASATTTMAAFFPILVTVGGVIGRYMEPLPKVVIFALCASLVEVFLMMPSHVVEFSRNGVQPKREVFVPIRRVYYPFLRVILRHRVFCVAVIVFSTVTALFLYFQTDFVMFPKSDIFPRFNIYFDMPINTSLERTREVLSDLSGLVKARLGQDLQAPVAVAGMKEINYEPILGYHYGMLNILLKPSGERKRSIAQLMEDIREDVGRCLGDRGALSFVMERMLEGPPVGPDVDLKIQASDWERAAAVSRLIKMELGRHNGIVDIRDDYSKEKQFLEVTVIEEKAKAAGLDQAQVTSAVQAGFYGLPVAYYHANKERQQIRLKYAAAHRADFDALVNLKVGSLAKGEVALKDVAEIKLVPGFHSLYHYNGTQTVRLTASVRDDGASKGFLSNLRGVTMTPARANAIAKEAFDRAKADYPEARLIAGGVQEDTNQSLVQLGYAAVMALFLIFFILAIEFNSILQPFIIMITIPFVSLGVLVGLLVGNNPITFVTLIGMLTLTGIVVNDSLVLIDFINRYKTESECGTYRAIVRACHVRLRPIILTSLTTIFGVFPMALGLGGKSPFWSPLATAIMWGLGFSTLLVLTMVPAYYAIVEDIRFFLKHRKTKKGDTMREINEAFLDPEVANFFGGKGR